MKNQDNKEEGANMSQIVVYHTETLKYLKNLVESCKHTLKREEIEF